MWNDNGYNVDSGMVSAMEAWLDYGLSPGSCTEFLLRGDYLEAYKYAHPLIKPYWDDHVAYVEDCVPDICRGENYDKWKGYDDYIMRLKCKVDLGENNNAFEVD